MEIGNKNEPEIIRGKKKFINIYNKKLRWLGALLATSNLYPQLDKIADAIFVSVYRDLGYKKEFDKAKIALNVQDDLLSAVDFMFYILSPFA
jgi:hypothetical protein